MTSALLIKQKKLWDAADSGDVSTVRNICEDGSFDVNFVRTQFKSTALFRACLAGRARVVEVLLRHPLIDVNKPQNEGSTPLHGACQGSHLEVVRLLLNDPRVDVNGAQGGDDDGATPFFEAVSEGERDILEVLMADLRVDVNRPYKGITPFYFVCQSNKRDTLEVLLRSPTVDVNRSMAGGGTPLLIACELGHRDIVERLLQDPRVNVNATEQQAGATPLWMASNKGKLFTVQQLLASGRKVDVQGRTNSGADAWSGKTALERARAQAHSGVVDLLEAYVSNPKQTVREIREELGLRDSFIEHLLGVQVSICVRESSPLESQEAKEVTKLVLADSMLTSLPLEICKRRGETSSFLDKPSPHSPPLSASRVHWPHRAGSLGEPPVRGKRAPDLHPYQGHKDGAAQPVQGAPRIRGRHPNRPGPGVEFCQGKLLA